MGKNLKYCSNLGWLVISARSLNGIAADPMTRFEEALETKSTFTQEQYKRNLLKFFEFAKVKDPGELLTVDILGLEDVITSYIGSIRDKNLSLSSQSAALNSIRLFCRKNRIAPEWTEIRESLKEQENSCEDKPYTDDQIRRMLEVAGLREKALVLFVASSGCRPGAVPDAKIRDLNRIDLDKGIYLYKFTAYSKSEESRYTTFLTPEASVALDNYVAWRKQCGEVVNDESPIFRAEFSKRNTSCEVRHLKRSAVNQIMTSLLVKAGLRTINNGSRERKESALYYGLRKRWNTICMNCQVYPVYKEIMIGHSVKLDDHYGRPTDENLLKEYLKAVGNLTVSKEKALQDQVEELKAKNASIDVMRDTMMKLKEENRILGIGYDQLKDMVQMMMREREEAGKN